MALGPKDLVDLAKLGRKESNLKKKRIKFLEARIDGLLSEDLYQDDHLKCLNTISLDYEEIKEIKDIKEVVRLYKSAGWKRVNVDFAPSFVSMTFVP